MGRQVINLLFGIFGTGGFGREVMPMARNYINQKYSHLSAGDVEVVFVETEPALDVVNNVRVLSAFEFINASAKEKFFNVAVGSSVARDNVAQRLVSNGCKPFSAIGNSAIIYDENKIGVGATICDNVTITSNAVIGAFFHANIYSYVAHDCVIGDYVTFAPRVSCNGNVVIEDYAYIGTGAVLKQGSKAKPLVIGRSATVGMGAVVTKDVAPNTVVVGNPAKPMIK